MSRTPAVTVRLVLSALLLLFGRAPLLGAQGLQRVLQDATAAEAAKNYAAAARLYERAYTLSGFDPNPLMLAASSAAAARDGRNALRLFERAIAEGFYQPGLLRYAEHHPDFAPLRAQPRWTRVAQQMRQRYAVIDTVLRAELLHLAEQDQRNRAGIDSVLAIHGRRSAEADSLFAALDRADAPLHTRVAEIVAMHGWPGRRLVGDDGAHAAWLVVQHAPLEYQQRMLPLLKAAAAKHEVRRGDLAFLEDRVLADEGKPQLYGSQARYSPTGGPGTVAPIADEPCVDHRRALVGLEPLSDYLAGLGITYRPPAASRPCTTVAPKRPR